MFGGMYKLVIHVTTYYGGADIAIILWLCVCVCMCVSKGKASSLDIAPLTILDSGALQPRKWQLTGTGYSTTAQASGCP